MRVERRIDGQIEARVGYVVTFVVLLMARDPPQSHCGTDSALSGPQFFLFV